MKYPANRSAGDRYLVPAGTYIAICDMIVDLGIQPGSGLYPAPKRQVFIRWEVPTERVDFEKDGKKQSGPAVIGNTYTASMHEKANLRHVIEGWRGKELTDEEASDFDNVVLLGKPCMVSVTHTTKGENTYANITGVSKLMKGVDLKTLIPEIVPIYYGPDNTAAYKQLPEWLRTKIDRQILAAPAAKVSPDADENAEYPPGFAYDGTAINDDDIPF